MHKQPSLVSLFAGAGGLDTGLEMSGFRTVFANEIEPYACETLRQNKILNRLSRNDLNDWIEKTVLSQRCYGRASPKHIADLHGRLLRRMNSTHSYLADAHISEDDVRSLKGADILNVVGLNVGEVDLIAGGPPCQPFSRAGKRQMVECDTGQLFLEFVRLVDEIRPRFFLFENVKGLVIQKTDVAYSVCDKCNNSLVINFELRSELSDGQKVQSQCDSCRSIQSKTIKWEKVRSGSLEIIENEFRRIGYNLRSEVLNAADYGAPQSRERLIIVGSRDGEIYTPPIPTHQSQKNSKSDNYNLELGVDRLPWRTMADTIFRGSHWKYGVLSEEKAVLWVKNVVRPHDEPVTWKLDRIAPTIGAHQAAKLAIAPDGVPEAQLFRQQWHSRGRRQGDTPPVFVEHEYLTDQELLQLQTFPNDWYLHGTRMQRAFQIGNAVPPVLAKAIGQQIVNLIQEGSTDSEQRERKYA